MKHLIVSINLWINRGLSLSHYRCSPKPDGQPGSASAGAASVGALAGKNSQMRRLSSRNTGGYRRRGGVRGKEVDAVDGQLPHTGAEAHRRDQHMVGAPNRYVCKFTIPGFGDIRSGYTGEVGLGAGSRGRAALARRRRSAAGEARCRVRIVLRPDALVKVVTTVERTKFSGRDCFKLKVEVEVRPGVVRPTIAPRQACSLALVGSRGSRHAASKSSTSLMTTKFSMASHATKYIPSSRARSR